MGDALVVAMIVVVVVSPPAVTFWLVETSGATSATPGRAAIASASSSVSVVEPSDDVLVGLIVSRFVPRLERAVVMFDVVPCPTPTRATTDATPMITPSIVRAARRRLVRRRENARRSSSGSLMPPPAHHGDGSAGRRSLRRRCRGGAGRRAGPRRGGRGGR